MVSYAVITICRNAADTIARTIGSVLRQDPLPEAYIFVDAASEDGTKEVIRESLRPLAETRMSVEILNQKPDPDRAGIPAAWNLALERVESDAVFILNADDWYEPETATTVLHEFAAEAEPDIVVSPIVWRSAPEAPACRVQRPRSLRLLPLLMPLPHPGCFIRRRVYERIGFYDERYSVSADYDFIYRAALASCRFRYLATPLVNMQPGGFARRRLALARQETREIGLRHCRLAVLPHVAYMLRTLLHR